MDDLDIGYALAKKVPDMRRGFRIETRYGEIDVDAEDAAPFADLVDKLLERKRRPEPRRAPLSEAQWQEARGLLYGGAKA